MPSNPAHLRFFLPKPLFSHSCEKKKKPPERNNLQEERSFLAWDSEALHGPCSRDGGSWRCRVGSSQETEVRPTQKRLQPFSPAPRGPTSSSSTPLLKDPTASPNSVTSWGPSVQTWSQLGSTSHPTPHHLCSCFLWLGAPNPRSFCFCFVWASPIFPTQQDLRLASPLL